MTLWQRKQVTWQYYFNSHPHEEDDGSLQRQRRGHSISTHILTKRMTLYGMAVWRIISHFNSHPHEEDDFVCKLISNFSGISTHILTKRMTLQKSYLYRTYSYFNSHPHEEDDGRYNIQNARRDNFNSHPHEEDDKFVPYTIGIRTIISTHILTKRMTSTAWKSELAEIFQLTSSRRG